jgi:hypothetical protein
LITVALLSAIVTTIVLLLSNINKKGNLKGTASTFLGLAAGVTLLAAAVSILAGLDSDKMLMAVGAVIVLMAAVALLSIVGGKVKLPLKTVLSMTVLLIAVAGIVTIMSLLNVGDEVLKNATALSELLLALAAAFWIISKAEGFKDVKKTATSLAIIVVVAALFSGILALMRLMDVGDNVLKNATALSELLLALAASFWIISKADGFKDVKSTGIVIGEIVVTAALFSGILALMRLMDVGDNVLKNATALSVLLLSMSGAFWILSNADGFQNSWGTTLITLAGIVAATALFGLILAMMNSLNVGEHVIANAVALGILMLAMSIVFAIITGVSVISGDFTSTLSAIGNFLILIGGLYLILIAMQGLNKLLGVDASTFMNETVPMFQAIGGAIGGFIGEFVEGVVGPILDLIPRAGEALGGFFSGILTALDGFKGREGEADVIMKLAGALLAITAAELLDQLIIFHGEKTVLDFVTTELPLLAVGVTAFANGIKDLTEDDIAKAGYAADMIGKLVNIAPRTGGLVQLLAGDQAKGFETLATNMPKMAVGVAAFAATILASKSAFTEENIAAVGNAAKMIDAIVNVVPPEGGLLQGIIGAPDLKKFGDNLPGLGTGVKGFTDAIKGIQIDETVVKNAGLAADAAAKITAAAPKEGGWFQDIFGEVDLEKFAENLPRLGKGLAGFMNKVASTKADQTSVDNALRLGQMLTGLNNSIPMEGSALYKFFVGDQSFGSYITNLKQFADAIKYFVEGIKDLDRQEVLNTKRVILDLTDLVQIAEQHPIEHLSMMMFDASSMVSGALTQFVNITGNQADLDKLSENAFKWANSFAEGFGDKAPFMAAKAVEVANQIVQALLAETSDDAIPGKFFGVGYEYGEKLQNGFSSESHKKDIVSSLAKTVGGFADDLKTEELQDKFVGVGKWILVRIKRGLSDSETVTSLKTAAKTNGPEKVKNTWDEYLDDFETVGKNFLAGLRDGINNAYWKNQIYNASYSAGSYAEQGIRDALDINSPSKVGEDLGGYFGQGFAGGIKESGSLVEKISGLLGGNALSSLKDSLSGSVSGLFGDAFANFDLNSMLGGSDVLSNLFGGIDLSSLLGGDSLTITPVLDLSQVESQMGDLGSLFGNETINLGTNGTFDLASATQQSANLTGGLDLNTMFGNLSQQMADFMNTPNVSNTNTFNITGDDPQAIADAVSKVLNEQTQREAVVWA